MIEPTNEAPEQRRAHWPSRLVAAALFFWIILIPSITQLVLWSADQVEFASGDGLPRWNLLAATAGSALLLIVPLLPLAIWWRVPRYRTIFRTWLAAALFSLLVSPIHLADPLQSYLAVILQIVLALLFALLFYVWRRRGESQRAHRTGHNAALWMALILAPVINLPWLIWGALGNPLDALLDLLAALAFGIVAALLIKYLADDYFTAIGADGGEPPERTLLLGGLISGAALAVMASAYGYHGLQLLLVLTVPALGWTAFSLAVRNGSVLATTLLVGLGAAGPLVMIDSAELAVAGAFLLSGLLQIAFQAAFYGMALGWASAIVLLVWRYRSKSETTGEKRPRTLASSAAIAALAWLLAITVYLFAGHPGLHGERLLVILTEQADLGAATEMEDVVERRRFVYETLVAQADRTQSDLRQTLERFGIEHKPFYLVNALEVGGGPLLRLWLESRPDVEEVLPVPVLRPAPLSPVTLPGTPAPGEIPWNVSSIGADRVWRELAATGNGIVIGQSDSGVQWDHQELRDSYRGGEHNHDYNWFDPWYHTEAPRDPGGHGTHTLGTVLGNTVGVAPDATWFACSNLPRNLGNPARYLDCLQFMLAPFPLDGDPFRDGDPERGANVLNNSWGCPRLEGCDAEGLLPAVRALRAAGTFIVVSAGNSGPECATVDSPLAIYDEVLTVGAVSESGNVTGFSSRGPVTVDESGRTKPDVMAPGFNILSAFPENDYSVLEGTSMAGPHVAGVVALMWSANPDLIGDVALTEQILLETANPQVSSPPACSATTDAPNNTYGYGIVDAYAAVQAALEASGGQ